MRSVCVVSKTTRLLRQLLETIGGFMSPVEVSVIVLVVSNGV